MAGWLCGAGRKRGAPRAALWPAHRAIGANTAARHATAPRRTFPPYRSGSGARWFVSARDGTCRRPSRLFQFVVWQASGGPSATQKLDVPSIQRNARTSPEYCAAHGPGGGSAALEWERVILADIVRQYTNGRAHEGSSHVWIHYAATDNSFSGTLHIDGSLLCKQEAEEGADWAVTQLDPDSGELVCSAHGTMPITPPAVKHSCWAPYSSLMARQFCFCSSVASSVALQRVGERSTSGLSLGSPGCPGSPDPPPPDPPTLEPSRSHFRSFSLGVFSCLFFSL